MLCCLRAKRPKNQIKPPSPRMLESTSYRYRIVQHPTEQERLERLEDDDLDTIVTGGPLDLDVVALRDDLATVDLAGDGGAGEHAISGGTGAGAGLPGGAAVGDDVDGAEVLVSEVSGWPACGVGGGGGQRGEQLSLGGSGHTGTGGLEVEDELAGVGLVLLTEGEGHQGGDVGTSVVGAAGDEPAGSVEVNGASLAVVLRSEVREDNSDGLAVWDNWWAAVSRGSGGSGSRGGCDNAGGVGVVVCLILTTGGQGSSRGKSAEAEDGSEDVG